MDYYTYDLDMLERQLETSLSDPSVAAGLAGVLSGMMAVAVVVLILAVAALIATVVAKALIFQRLRRPAWAALIPYWSDYVMCDAVHCRRELTLAVPIVGAVAFALAVLGADELSGLCTLAYFVLTCVMAYMVARACGHGAGWTVGMVLLPFVFWPLTAAAFGQGSAPADGGANFA